MGKDCCGCGSDLASREGHRRSLGTSKGEKALNVWRKVLKKYKKSDREQKLLKDSGNLMMCRKCFSAYERYYKLEADIEKTLLRTFDDGGGDEKGAEGEVEAGVTGACEGVGDSPPPDVFPATSKKRPRPASSSSPATPSRYRRVKHSRFSTSSPGVSVRTN